MNSINSIFRDKKILVTGHTGFKGSWLSAWLSELGGKVIGVSNKVPTSPAHYDLINNEFYDDRRIDIKDINAIFSIIEEIKPRFVFHLAAQPIVLESYENPINTFTTNTLGTANILDALRRSNHKCIAVFITSDKCYANLELKRGYHEMDRLGGKDPYSGSKGAAELVIRSYVESFFKKNDSNIRIGIGRAGNVIGGGDWAPQRIVPDCAQSWAKNSIAEIRNPNSTRPWQHVLEPLSGYLSLAAALSNNNELNGEAFNFGPPASQDHTVKELVEEIIVHWPGSKWVDKSSNNNMYHEAGLLKLNCNKALNILKWMATLNFEETAKWTADWYRMYYEKDSNLSVEITNKQIREYMLLAEKRKSFILGQ